MCISAYYGDNLCVYRLTAVATYAYNYFHFMSTYVYECMIDFICSNLYLIRVVTHMYNDSVFYNTDYTLDSIVRLMRISLG